MPIHIHKSGGFSVTGPEAIRFYRMAVLQGALSLEIKGLRHSRGSAYATIKREYGLKGSRESVLKQFKVLVEEASASIPRIEEES